MTFRALFQYKIFTVSNLLSLLRIFLVPVAGYFMAAAPSHPACLNYALITGLVMIASDWLDGWLARRLGQETPLGQYLDPVADKIASIGILLVLQRYYHYPLLVIAFVAFRELLGSWGGIYLLVKKNVLAKPNYWGKAGIFLLAISAIFYLLAWPGKEITAWAVMAVYGGSIVAYARTYWQTAFARR